MAKFRVRESSKLCQFYIDKKFLFWWINVYNIDNASVVYIIVQNLKEEGHTVIKHWSVYHFISNLKKD